MKSKSELWKVNNTTNEYKQHIWNPAHPAFCSWNIFIPGDTGGQLFGEAEAAALLVLPGASKGAEYAR